MQKTIQLIGVQNSIYFGIKDQLLQIIPSFEGDIKIEEVIDIDAIVSLELRRIPAVAIDKKVVFQHKQTALGFEELTKLLQPYL